MTRLAPCLAALLLAAAGCGAGSDPDCATATQHVTDCYGAEIGDAFAEACTPELAATALAEDCQSTEEGKADSYSTPILSPPVEHFKYGSIGSDKMGVPLVVWKALPLVCADTLPAGANPYSYPMTSFGMIYEAGKDVPIGFSSRRLPLIGTTLIGNTCSACHTTTVRETATSQRYYYLGAPNIRFDIQAYNDFMLGCIGDPARFNTSTLLWAFDQLGVSGFDRLVAYKASMLRAFTSDLEIKAHSVVTDGPWGPGRDDAIGLSAAFLLGEEFLPTIPAPVDFPSVWNQDERRGHALHWDGASGSAQERNVLVAVGAGTPQNGVPLQSIAAIQTYLEQLAPPQYPYAIDQTKTARGAELFAARCASCHAADGARTWSVIDLAELGTDPNRVDSVTQAGIDRMNSLSGTGWQFDQFRKTNGYLTGILDGIWLRAPYLHNGSVPTLRDLLKPPAARPTTFYRGNDTYNAADVGYVSTIASEGASQYMFFDTGREGNSNAGHDYGTDLPSADIDALLEYMKTL